MKKYIIGLFLISIFLTTSGAICSNSGTMPAEIEIEYWSAAYSEDDIRDAILAFEAMYPYVNIQFKKLNYDEYEEALISGWAKGQGPDVFSIPNTELHRFAEYIEPMPSALTVTTVTEKKTFGKKELVIQDIAQKGLSPEQLNNQFVDVVYKDAVIPHQGAKEKSATNKVFGVPLSLDTLALYWNRDLLNQASVSFPATDWQSVVDHTKLLTKVDKSGNVIQSGIALGTTENISNYFDIISVLMMQFGTDMVDGNGSVVFSQSVGDDKRYPGQEALDFYTKFSNEEWETYNWNDDKVGALNSFVNGELAYYVGYHYELDDIKQLAPNLNFDIAPLPQISTEQQVNYASYWLETVSSNATNSDLAWAFVQYLTNEENTKNYLEKNSKPAARRMLINNQLEDYELAIFAEQALTAKTWYRGKDYAEARNIFSQMIDNARSGEFDLEDILFDAVGKIELTF